MSNLAADALVGKLILIDGTVTIKRTGLEKAVAAKEGDDISVTDILQTGKDSRAQIVFTDDSVINMSSEAGLRVNQYVYDSVSNRRKAVVKVLKGKTRFVIHKYRSRGSGFTVETDKALVTANIADFVVAVLPAETEVAVLDSGVSVKNISFLTVGVIRLSVNQKTIVKEKTPPSQPSVITLQQRRAYIKDVHNF
ncbi:MAG: FecR domain-containing protein [Nitrospirae bacterium]|nr:FecR domain-containing protein [Nitrospirota bacterium]